MVRTAWSIKPCRSHVFLPSWKSRCSPSIETSGRLGRSLACKLHGSQSIEEPLRPASGCSGIQWILFKYTALLADAVGHVDAFASPPSDHPLQAEPYRRAIANRQPNAADVTTSFTRRGEARAGIGATFDAIVSGLDYAPCGREREWRRVAIIDDVFRSGVTAAAMVTQCANTVSDLIARLLSCALCGWIISP